MPDAHRAKPDIEVRETHREQAAPCEEHVAAIETTDTIVGGFAYGSAREAIEHAADQMPERVAAECVATQKDGVGEQDERADVYSEMAVKPHGLPCIVSE